MRPLWWMLIGLLVVGDPRPSDADERLVSNDSQASRFERLLKQRPNDPALHYNLGTTHYQHGRYDKAAESLKLAVASSGSSLQGRASYNLGNAHYRLGRATAQTSPNQAVGFYQKALEDYRFAIRQDPKDADAKYNYELVEHWLKAFKAQQEKAQSAQREQAKQEQNQQAQAQRQTEQAGESQQQQQQAASAESKSEPESQSSMEAAQGTDPQQQGQPAQAARQQPAQQGSEQSAQAVAESQNMSQQQALWILDTLKNEERGALVKEHQGPAREPDVDQDW